MLNDSGLFPSAQPHDHAPAGKGSSTPIPSASTTSAAAASLKKEKKRKQDVPIASRKNSTSIVQLRPPPPKVRENFIVSWAAENLDVHFVRFNSDAAGEEATLGRDTDAADGGAQGEQSGGAGDGSLLFVDWSRGADKEQSRHFKCSSYIDYLNKQQRKLTDRLRNRYHHNHDH